MLETINFIVKYSELNTSQEEEMITRDKSVWYWQTSSTLVNVASTEISEVPSDSNWRAYSRV